MREVWDSHYDSESYIFGTEPNVFLAAQKPLLKACQHVLAVADGEGRNGVWLAQQGLDVLSVDISPIGQAKAKKLAAEKAVDIQFEEANLLSWDWGKARFDVIVAIFIQFVSQEDRTKMFQHIKQALKPGGLLILQGYTPKQLEYKTGGPGQVENLYTPKMLQDYFADMEILHLQEHEEFIAEGTKHHGMSALVDMVARKLA
ncbi:class I SAM-dependent methyltransferase [Sulfurirhabdus autotrophica]|uniref:Methyltransferase family protein n=1 Tax=Sulfurirhabdus autotrophica TaxID=1706046 RepID=A0A4R3Y1W5_9PROT|nr:class I SAM-dependent methyltransferase [Sulfurirhabdus autotrophica]TCV84688.1 methyltransferase family protein [Sulfurirhabdus autotrophica]